MKRMRSPNFGKLKEFTENLVDGSNKEKVVSIYYGMSLQKRHYKRSKFSRECFRLPTVFQWHRCGDMCHLFKEEKFQFSHLRDFEDIESTSEELEKRKST